MTAYPRTSQRRPVRATPPTPGLVPSQALETADRPTAAPPTTLVSRHIPRLVVLPGSPAEGASAAETTGAHRFPGRPTPVLGAALGLLGLRGLDAACRPWRRLGKSYRVTRPTDDPSGRDQHALSSTHLPKV